jgi:hypothetical protein
MENKPSILQAIPIDVAKWSPDEIYANYPEGARPKSAFFPPRDIDLPFINTKRRYLYKLSDKKYPDQYWSEVVAYLAGGLLDVPVPPAFAAFNSLKKDCGALIEWFYEDGKAQFTAGGQYMMRMLPDYDRKKGKQHNYRTISQLCGIFTRAELIESDWKKWWFEGIVFDALIGNTDRHQDNWGFLSKRTKLGSRIFSMAPLFDNGTSLGHELNVVDVAKWQEDRYGYYIGRGRHHMKWLLDETKGRKHLDLVERVKEELGEHVAGVKRKLEQFDLEVFAKQLSYLSTFAVTVPLTLERKNLYIKLVGLRRERLIELLK